MTKHKISASQLAEQAGHHTARTAMDAMRKASTQAQRLEILIDALADIYSSSAGSEEALIGFAVGLIAPLENGLGVRQC
jgi:hypothetical protein